jgi:hypothetical protein
MITKNLSTCKPAGKKLSNPVDIGIGNIVPHWWYSTILTTGGKADTMAIALLSELWFLYRSTGQEEHQKDYDYFCNKFNLSTYQIRESFIRLEALDLMKRSIGSIVVQGRKFANILFVTLNVKKLLEMSPSYLQAGSNDDDNDNNQKGSDNKRQDSISLDDRVGESKDSDLEILDARIIKKNLRKNRSSESTFVSNSFLEKENSSATVTRKQRFSFASFYPLAQSDIDKLQYLCGREFSGNAINEILQSLSIKLPNHSFPHKAAFIKYMGKALAHEMRDAVKISNESFKIKSNITAEEIITQAREEFLNEIENSRDTSLKMQLSRKLAGILEPSIAYDFLMSASFVDNTASLKTDSFKIILRKNLTLSQSERRLILTQVQSVYGDHINALNITSSQDVETTDTSFKQPQVLQKEDTKSFEGVWGKIRQGLIDYYGSGGNAMDNAWFSKLTANVDADNKKLTLKAPSKFIKDWVQSNYTHLIDKLCSLHSYSLEEVQYA